jgi:F-type H+-transporting ATPase subunit b
MLLGSSIFLLPNGTFFVELILFILMIGFIAKVVLPPLQKAMDDRAQTIRSAQQASDEGQVEAEQLVAQRRAILERARATARSALETAAAEADRLYEDGRARGTAEHDRLLADAQPGFEAERRAVEEELLERMGGLVVQAAGRVLGEQIDASKHREIIAGAVSQANWTSQERGRGV